MLGGGGVQGFQEARVRGLQLGLPRPETGVRIPISWKRGLRGPKTLISPRLGKGSFLPKTPLFSSRDHSGKGIF